MYDLIVLGQVPGTHIQITFELFMLVLLCMVLALLLFVELRHFHVLKRVNERIIELGHITRKLLVQWQHTLPPKLQLFK